MIGETLKESLFNRVMFISMHSRNKKDEDFNNITYNTSTPHVYLGHARKQNQREGTVIGKNLKFTFCNYLVKV